MVIVVGILAALAVDGRVQDRVDRRAEIAYLKRLTDEYSIYLDQLAASSTPKKIFAEPERAAGPRTS